MPNLCSVEEQCPLPSSDPSVGMKFHNSNCSMELTVLSCAYRDERWYMVLLQRWPDEWRKTAPVETALDVLASLDFHQTQVRSLDDAE